MSQVVESERGQSSFFDGNPKVPPQVSGIHPSSMGVGKDRSLKILLFPKGTDHYLHPTVHVDVRRFPGFAISDKEGSCIEVDILPIQLQKFPLAKSCVQRDRDDGMESLRKGVEEAFFLVRGEISHNGVVELWSRNAGNGIFFDELVLDGPIEGSPSESPIPGQWCRAYSLHRSFWQ
jgi:hypothetical protein|nr:hypothetical protein [Leptospirillum ferrooxidans]